MGHLDKVFLIERRKRLIIMGGLMLLLVLSVARINFGIWNSDIPLGDESGYIEHSFNLFKKGSYSSNLFFDTYVLCFKYITQDPIVAYYYVRFIASLLSVVGLFLLLSSLNWVSPFGAFAMALLWNLNLLTTPVIQYGNINLFAFAIACFAGYLWLSDFGKGAKFISLVIMLFAVSARVEYAILLALIGIQSVTFWIEQHKSDGWSKQRSLEFCLVVGIVLIPMGTIALSAHFRNSASELFSYLDGYLFMGLQQCYAAFSVASGTGLSLEPMTEFNSVMSKSFPGASGFFQAVSTNPIEIARYFSLNAINNLLNLYRLLPTHSIILPTNLAVNEWQGLAKVRLLNYVLWTEQIVICLGIAIGSMWLLITKLVDFERRRLWKIDSLFFILSLAAVSVTAIILLIPDPRYWITVVPLLFWGPAALISKYSTMCSHKIIFCLSIMLPFVFVNPVFTSSLNIITNTDKNLVLTLRKKLSPIKKTPVKALGVWPYPLLVFAIPGRGQSTDNSDVRKSSSYEALVKLKENDLVIVDAWLMGTQQYKKEHDFFDSFLKHPEMYGYEHLLISKKRDGPIYIYKRSEIKM